MSTLYFLQVPGSVDDPVEDNAIAAEEPLDISLGAERGCVDPYLIAHALKSPDQIRCPEAQAFFFRTGCFSDEYPCQSCMKSLVKTPVQLPRRLPSSA